MQTSERAVPQAGETALPAPHVEAVQAEAAARDELASFAGKWAGSVYQSSPFFGELRRHLDAYRDAIEARVLAEGADRGSEPATNGHGTDGR
jgi:hypothetical protein